MSAIPPIFQPPPLPHELELTVKVSKLTPRDGERYPSKDTVWESSISVPLLPDKDVRPLVESWLNLMAQALAFVRRDGP
jgi:hypothetical protein